MYQLFRSLAYIHSLGICHRDIKPQNLLLDPETGVLKLCDFGSAKHLVKGEPNVSYICSRYYRAPELIFGAIDYTTKIGELVNHLCTDREEDLNNQLILVVVRIRKEGKKKAVLISQPVSCITLLFTEYKLIHR